MKKKIMAAVLVVTFALALAGCSTVQNVESGIDSMLSTLKADAEKLLGEVVTIGKTTIEVIKEDEQTVRYKITLLEDDAKEKISELEGKVGGIADDVANTLQSLKDKGVNEAKIIISVINEKGEELYQKIFE